jgi:hypothetical protein
MHNEAQDKLSFRFKKSLLEVVGFHFVIGAGTSTVVAAFLLLWRIKSNYPFTLACGGTFVIVIQLLFLMIPAIFRRTIFRRLLLERNLWITILIGFAGSAMVFVLPIVIANFTSDFLSSILGVLIPLVMYPLATSFIVFRCGGKNEMTKATKII